MGQKTFIEYYKIVGWRALRRAWDKLGALGTFLGLVVSIVLALLVSRPRSLSEIGGNIAVLTGIIFLGIFVVVLVVYLLREPVIVHNEQERELTVFRNRLSPKLRVVCSTGSGFEYGRTIGSRLEIRDKKATMPDSTEYQLVRLKVENISDETIHNVEVRLESSEPNVIPPVLPIHLHRMHDNRQPYQTSMTLSPRQYEFFDVAQLAILYDDAERQQLAIQLTHAEAYGSIFLLDQKAALTLVVYGEGVQPCKRKLSLVIDSRGRLRLKQATERKGG